MKTLSVPLLAVLCAGTLTTSAQQPGGEDPFVKDGGLPAPATAGNAEANKAPKECLLRMEVFTLSQADGRKVMRQFPKQADLYAWLGAELEKEKSAVKLEHLSLVRVRSGQRSKIEEIAEYSYPTEFDPPQIPQNIGIGQPVPGGNSSSGAITPAAIPVPAAPAPAPATPPAPEPASPGNGTQGEPGVSGTAGTQSKPLATPGASQPGRVFPPWPYTPTTPSAFSTRNTGWTTEVELTVGADGFTVDLTMAPEFVKFCGLVSQSPNGEIMQPTFETSSYSGTLTCIMDRPTFAGTLSPAVSTGAPGGNTADVTRLLFLTVTDPR